MSEDLEYKMKVRKRTVFHNDSMVIDLKTPPIELRELSEDHWQAFLDIKVQELECEACGSEYVRVLIDNQVVTGGTVTTFKDGKN